ncbi:hypothetical protein [Terriglobus roseus]|nr:hypothetical protein [Terriglobus roseus]
MRASGGRCRPSRLAAGLLLWLLAAVCAGVSLPAEAQVAVTAVSDTVYHADGSAAAGMVLISWPGFATSTGQTVAKGSTSVTLGAGGSFSVSLAPNVGATPAGTYYTAVYHLDDGTVSREYWTVPVSSSAVKLTAVRTSVLPTSVAMQTVTKQYVDQAISRAVLTGAAPADASPYVEKAGDTMTGPLTLPGDPLSGLQATTKNYVDAGTAGVQAGLGQKVSTIPQASQTVMQPTGTQLQTSRLNGQLFAKEYLSQGGNDGIANAFASSDCAAGCSVVADQTYPGSDVFSFRADKTRLTDERGGVQVDTSLNPLNGGPVQGVTSYMTTPAYLLYGAHAVANTTTEVALAGGNNLFPEDLGAAFPYFKTTYAAQSFLGLNYTPGQHVLTGFQQKCYGVGDCLIGGQFITSSGGTRDNADEGAHPFDISVAEDTAVFQGTCATGCSTGSTQIVVTATSGAGTQGEGRFVINKALSKTIATGAITGGSVGTLHATAQFSGTSFPVSTLFRTASLAVPQSTRMAPGTVTLAIATSGVPGGYSTNTASAPAASGIACLANTQGASDYFETAPYTVVDGSHIQFTLTKPHSMATTIAIGGLCGYGIEQTVDTVNGIRQVFPVIASTSPTSLFYSSLMSTNLGQSLQTSAYTNLSSAITSMQRAGNVVTVNLATNLPGDVNGLQVTVSGAADASFNGRFTATTNAANQFTFSQTGANASTTGGTAAVLTGDFVLYPMVEVVGVVNASTTQVDGTLKLAPNNVAWAAGDPVEEPHFYAQRISGDTTYLTQYMPRGSKALGAGIVFNGTTGLGVTGWTVQNNAPASQYYGNGGTHVAPTVGMSVKGPWLSSLDLQAGDQNGIVMRCNSHGCNRWNSAYNLFTLQSNGSQYDTVNYVPSTSTMTFNLNGAQYTMSPTALSAGTINATTLNVARINGLQAATSASIGGVTLGPAATASVLANVASSGSAADLTGLAPSATVDTTNASNITSGTLDAARLPAGYGVCASNVAYSATPTFAVTCANATFHVPLNGNVTSENFTGLAAGQHITLIFQVGATAGYTVGWSANVHGGFLTSSTSGAAGYTLAGKYLVQQLVVDTDGTTLLNPGAINE